MPDSLLTNRLLAVIDRHADEPAIEGQDGSLSYRELDRRAARLSGLLARAGVGRGAIVPLFMRRSPDLIVAQVAVLRLGAAYAPIDLASPPHRQQAMANAAGATVVLTDGSQPLPGLAPGTTSIPWPQTETSDRESGISSHAHTAGEVDAAYVMFTSGSTGTPKGVVVPSDAIVRLVCDADYAEFPTGGRWAFLSSPAFDAATLEVWGPLLNGGCCVVQERALPSLDELASFIVDRRIEHAWLTSSLFNALVEDCRGALGGLKQLLVGGERVSPRHVQLMLGAHPDVRLINGYGPTENTTFTLCHTITWNDTLNPNGIPIGLPINGTDVRIGHDAIEPETGELLASGRGLSIGYLHDPDLTRRKFVDIDGLRWYRTGDLVHRRQDGVFEYLGRMDGQVKIQGNRIEIDEVEAAMSSCPGVGDAAVIVAGGSAESRHLVGFYTQLSGPAPTASEVTAFLSQRLAPHAVPRRLEAVDRLPLNLSGKVDRPALESLLSKSSDTQPPGTDDWVTDAERSLAAIWKSAIPHVSIGRHSHFTQIGGTSLLALKVSSAARRELRRDLSPIDILRVPVLHEQARVLEAAPQLDDTAQAVTQGGDSQVFDLTLGQQAALNGGLLDPTGSAFLVHVALHIPTQRVAGALRSAFVALADRHLLLRCLIRREGERFKGIARDSLPSGWWQEHTTLDSAPTDLDWPPSLVDFVNRRLETGESGVMRVDYWPVADGSALIVWTCDHAVIDEESISLALGELHRLLKGESLPPVYGSPVAFPALERAWTDHAALRTEPQVVVNALRGHPSPVGTVPGTGREVSFRIPEVLARSLDDACARWGTTPFAPLLTAYGLSLQECFGAAHRFVMTPFSRRVEPELVDPLGYLLDLRLIEAGARDGETGPATLGRVRQAVLALQRRAFLPTVMLASAVQALEPAVAAHLDNFGFTWRFGATREVALGAGSARLIRVPQQSARFGVCVHVVSGAAGLSCSVEALEDLHASGLVDHLMAAFLRHLEHLCSLPLLPAPPQASVTPAKPLNTAGPRGVTHEGLARIWLQAVQASAGPVRPDNHFLQSGGNSLSAMRMASQIHRQLGQRIDLGEFLANPTFAHLCAMANHDEPNVVSSGVWIGPENSAHVVVVFPGAGGHALGMYQLAEKLQAALGPQFSAVIVDIEDMFVSAPAEHPAWYLIERSLQLLREIGLHRIKALVGFSIGSLLAMQLVRRLSPMEVTCCAIDGYAPRVIKNTLAYRMERRFSRLLDWHPAASEAPDSGTEEEPSTEPFPPHVARIKCLWERVTLELSCFPAQVPNARVHLVRATRFTYRVGLLWRKATNGFDPRDFASMKVHEVAATHLQLPREFASETAELLAGCIR